MKSIKKLAHRLGRRFSFLVWMWEHEQWELMCLAIFISTVLVLAVMVELGVLK